MPISSPTDIADCELYLDADADVFSDAGSTPAAIGDTVQQWNDQSGNARHAAQGTGGNRPTFTKINGVGALRFLSSHFLDTGSFFGSAYDAAFTEFIVLEHETPPFAVVSGDLGGGFRHDITSASNIEQAEYYTPHLSATTYAPTISRQSNRVEVTRYDGSTKRFRIAGPDSDTNFSVAATGNLGVSGAFRVGEYSGGGFGFPGFVRCAGIFSRKLTDAETDDLVAWALAKFAAHSSGALSSGVDNAIVVCDGNSLTAGGQNGSTPYPTQLGTLLGAGYTVSNKGISSVRIGHMLTDRFRTLNTVDALWSSGASQNICVYFEGINDVTNGASGEQSFQRTKEYGLRRKYKGFQVIVCTTPKAGVTTTPQETARQNLNILIRSNWASFADGMADLAADPAFSDPSDATYYQTDTIHFTTAGYAVVAGLVQAAINGLGGDLVAGVASFVSSGPGGISALATDASGGSTPYSYQWQRNEDGGAFTDLSGATSLALDDATATTEGILYGYKLTYTDHSSATITSNEFTAQAYEGGAIGGDSGGGGTPPATPSLTIADNGDGTGAVATISGSGSGSTNDVRVAPSAYSGNLAFSDGGSRLGDGDVPLSLANGTYVAYVESTLDGLDALPSNFAAFTVSGGASGSGRAIEPTGHQAIIHAGVAWLLASSAAWQAYLGVGTAAEALARIPAESDDSAESGSARPRIIVYPAAFRLEKVSLTDFRPSGEVWVSFELPPADAIENENTREDRLWDEMVAFCNLVDAILADCLALQGTGSGVIAGASHVAISSINLLDGPSTIEDTRAEGQAGETAQQHPWRDLRILLARVRA